MIHNFPKKEKVMYILVKGIWAIPYDNWNTIQSAVIKTRSSITAENKFLSNRKKYGPSIPYISTVLHLPSFPEKILALRKILPNNRLLDVVFDSSIFCYFGKESIFIGFHKRLRCVTSTKNQCCINHLNWFIYLSYDVKTHNDKFLTFLDTL